MVRNPMTARTRFFLDEEDLRGQMLAGRLPKRRSDADKVKIPHRDEEDDDHAK